MLEIRSLTAGYPRCPVLEDISLSLPEGALTVIAGPNGCGKSTLLKALSGVLPAAGSMKLAGRELLTLPPRELARNVAYLPQSRQVPELTVRRLVLHGRFPYLGYPRRYRKEDHLAAEEAMDALGLIPLADRNLSSLSGGQRQKAYIAMALAQQTAVVLLDEPTTYLDIAHQMQLMDCARTLADSGKTVVLVLHDLTLALEQADYLVILDRGRPVCQGDPESVYASGKLAGVFGAEVRRADTPDGWKYYYGHLEKYPF